MNANKQNPIFYSALLRSVEISAGSPRQADAATWQQWLDGAQRRGEFKQSERDWIGVDAWLDGRATTTRDELAEFVRANQVDVQETVLGGESDRILPAGAIVVPPNEESEALGWGQDWTVIHDGRVIANGPTEEQARNKASRPVVAPTKFSSYQTPGGQNYRELLLTLPVKTTLPDGFSLKQIEAGPRKGQWAVIGPGPLPENRYGTGATQAEAIAEFGAHGHNGPTYKSSHFDQPNILAHVRFNERTDTMGSRVLFVEEVQSDWHQAGRKQGYGDVASVDDTLRQSGTMRDEWDRMTSERQMQLRRQVAGFGFKSGVPDAPLKKEWPLTAMKRMIRYAVDKGFDRIAWTTGDMAADLFDLRKQVSLIRVVPGARNTSVPVGKRQAIITKADGTDINLMVGNDGLVSAGPFNAAFNGMSLDEIVGKEVAEKIMAAEKETALRGDGLKVGGSGMRAFYDKMLPNELGKYVKKWGGKVGTTEITSAEVIGDIGEGSLAVVRHNGETIALTDYDSQAHAIARENPGSRVVPVTSIDPRKGSAQHSIDITPAMREAALQGQPLFSSASEHVVLPSPKASSGSGITHDLPSRRSATTDAMSAYISRHLGTPYRAEAVVLPKDIVEPLRVFGQVFGKQVVVFRTVEGRLPANGLTVGDGVIYVNEASPSPVLTVAAHELLHEIRSARPDLYAFVRAAVEQRADFQRWKAALARRELTSGAWRLSDDKAMEELVADAFGDAMTDPDFLDDLANRNPGKFQAFVAMAVEFFTKIFRALRKPVQRLGSHAFLSDLEGLHRAYSQMLDDYVGGIMPSRSSGLLQFQAAWHGTPHKVDRFRMDKIGTGEGAQACGWGMYFASAREIAEHYKTTLSEGGGYEIDGVSYHGMTSRQGANKYNHAADALERFNGDREAAIEWLDDFGIGGEAREVIKNAKSTRPRPSGNLYRVEVPEDSDLLDWDQPLSAQPAKVRTALIELGVGQYAEVQVNSATENDRYVFGSDKDAETFAAQKRAEGSSVQIWLDSEWPDKGSGKTVYEDIARMFELDDAMWERIGKTPHDVQNIYQAASEYLRSAGIPGLRYLDGNSRAEGQGSHNYVIWDEAAIGAPVAQFSQDCGREGEGCSYPADSTAIEDKGASPPSRRRIGMGW